MPAFAMLSGMVSNTNIDVKQGKKLLATIVIPYLVFQAIYLFVGANGDIYDFSYQITTPYWIMWYLLSLFMWRLLLPIVICLRHPLLISVIISLFAGFFEEIGYYLSLSRTLVFLPFFVAGFIFSNSNSSNNKTFIKLNADKSYLQVILSIFGVLILILMTTYLLLNKLPFLWLYGSVGYDELHISPWYGLCMRLLLLICGAIGCFVVLQLAPNRAGVCAWVGQNSLSVYLLHGIVILLLFRINFFTIIEPYPLVTIIIAPLMVFILSYVGRHVRFMMDYRRYF